MKVVGFIASDTLIYIVFYFVVSYQIYLLSLPCRKTVYRDNVTLEPNTYTVWLKMRGVNATLFIYPHDLRNHL